MVWYCNYDIYVKKNTVINGAYTIENILGVIPVRIVLIYDADNYHYVFIE